MNEQTVQDLTNLFLQTNDLKKIVNKAAQVLKNPLVVCDTSYHILARSSISGVTDQSWRRGLKHGSWSYELVSRISKCDLDYSGRTHKTDILTNINEITSVRRMIGTLCFEGLHLGYYLILEGNVPFDEIEEDVYRQVEMILSKCLCLERPFRLSGGRDSSESIIFDLLQSHFDSEQLFLKRAAKSELAGKGNYCVFCIDAADSSSEDAGAQSAESREVNDIRSVIGQCLPLSWQVFYQKRIVVLADFSAEPDQKQSMLKQLCTYLEEHQYSAGCSDYFPNTYDLKYHYEQACAALDLGRALGEQNRLIPYEDYKLFDLFRHTNGGDLFAKYSTEIMRTICQYDEQNGTDYMETICQYVGNRCSVRKTADSLFVHRNTVVYRISRIEELFGLTFEDDRKNFLNYTSCLLYKYGKNCTGTTEKA